MNCAKCGIKIEIDCCIDDDVTGGAYWADLYGEHQDHPLLSKVLCNVCAQEEFDKVVA